MPEPPSWHQDAAGSPAPGRQLGLGREESDQFGLVHTVGPLEGLAANKTFPIGVRFARCLEGFAVTFGCLPLGSLSCLLMAMAS